MARRLGAAGPIALLLLGVLMALSGCAANGRLVATEPDRSGRALPVAAAAPPPGSVPERVSALRDRRGLHPGLSPVPASQQPAARVLIAAVATAPAGSHSGYRREQGFGPAWTDAQTATWGRDGCKTREEILHRDLKGIDFRAGTDDCVVLGGILQEPYTGRTIEFSKSRPSEVQIDHVMPLAYDWAQGARYWTADRRRQIANDPLNLLAVDGPSNQAKSDKGPADWMPPNRLVHCAYAARIALISRKYTLPVTPQDKAAMWAACAHDR